MSEETALLSQIAERQASLDMHLQISAKLKDDCLSFDSSNDKMSIESDALKLEETPTQEEVKPEPKKPKKKRRKRKRLLVNWIDVVLENKRKIKRQKREKKKAKAEEKQK